MTSRSKSILDKILSEPDRAARFQSLEMILADYPLLDLDSPMLYQIYMNVNEGQISDEEKMQCNAVILKLKMKMTAVNKENIAYMERHKNEEAEEEVEQHGEIPADI
jgi:hypothetical protein